MKDPRDVIIKPVVSEKSYAAYDENVYTFIVSPNANKIEIRKAVEALFKVNVLAVNTMTRKGKVKGLGWRTYARPSVKRALVTLKAGQAIEFV